VRILGTIENETIMELSDDSVHWVSKAAIDSDGSGPHYGDKTPENDTTLHLNGAPLESDKDIYIVVPPLIIESVKGVVLGCQALVKNQRNGRSTMAVVGDIGPHKKLGEISIECAIQLGIDPSPVVGGEDRHIIEYVIWPGMPAKVYGKQYNLQPYKA
jgi:hypothetical protein